MEFFHNTPAADKSFQRLQAIADLLRENYMITDREPCSMFQIADGETAPTALNAGEWRNYDGEREPWRGGAGRFRQIAKIPPRFKGKDIYYALQITGIGRQTGVSAPGFLLFADGQPVSGMDRTHTAVKLLSSAQGDETVKLHFWAKHSGHAGKWFLYSELRVLDYDVRRLYFHLTTVLGIAAHGGAAGTRLCRALCDACERLDLTVPYGPEFIGTVKNTYKYIEDTIFGDDANTAISVIGQAFSAAPENPDSTFAAALYLMREYPELRFLAPEAQLYAEIKQKFPALFEQIKKRVRDGKWEAEGGMWTAADTALASGEALIRQFLLGKQFFKAEFDKTNELLWLPDLSGVSGALPQIMRGCGIRYLFTADKPHTDAAAPAGSFLWEGIDGSQVIARCAPAQKNVFDLPLRTAFDDPNPLYSCETTPQTLEHALRIKAGIPGCPKVQFSLAGENFRRLERDMRERNPLRKWRGELGAELPGSALSACGTYKRYNRTSECLYQSIETINSMASLLLDTDFSRYPKTGIDAGWKTILQNQSHSVTANAAAYAQALRQYEKIAKDGRYLLMNAAERIANSVHTEGDALTVCNTLGFSRTGTVETTAALGEDMGIFDYEGIPLPCQATYDGKTIFLAPDIPAKGYKALRICPKGPDRKQEKTAVINGNHIQTVYYDIDFSEQMEIVSLYCRKIKKQVVPKGKAFNRLTAAMERPYRDGNSPTVSYFEEQPEILGDVLNARVMENGPVRAVLQITRNYKNARISQYIMLYNHTERIDIRTLIERPEARMCVKAEFPVDVNTDKATYAIPFGYTERPTHSNTPADMARTEVPMQAWVDLSDNGFGVSILNDGVYGCACSGGCIRLPLLRVREQTAQDTYTCTYAIYPHDMAVAASAAVQNAADLNTPLFCAQARGCGNLPRSFSLLRCEQTNIMIETVKKVESDTEDSVIVRAYETWNRRTVGMFTSDLQIEELSVCDMLEESERPLRHTEPNAFTAEFRPFEIKTFKIKFH